MLNEKQLDERKALRRISALQLKTLRLVQKIDRRPVPVYTLEEADEFKWMQKRIVLLIATLPTETADRLKLKRKAT